MAGKVRMEVGREGERSEATSTVAANDEYGRWRLQFCWNQRYVTRDVRVTTDDCGEMNGSGRADADQCGGVGRKTGRGRGDRLLRASDLERRISIPIFWEEVNAINWGLKTMASAGGGKDVREGEGGGGRTKWRT